MNTFLRASRWVALVVLVEAFAQGAEPKPRVLALKEAAEIALQRHPSISAAELKALAAKQVMRETRAAYFPTVSANVTAVGASGENTRIAAGGLNNSPLPERNAQGTGIRHLSPALGAD